MLDDPNVVVIDIRDIRERMRTGFIPGSVHAPRGMVEFWVDPESPYFKDVFGQEGKTFVFHCAAGWRSALTVATLQDMGFEGPPISVRGFRPGKTMAARSERDGLSRSPAEHGLCPRRPPAGGPGRTGLCSLDAQDIKLEPEHAQM